MVCNKVAKIIEKVPVHKTYCPLIFFLFFLCVNIEGQQAVALYEDHYAGIHGVVANPGFHHHGMLDWDINLGSGHGFIHTNYAFLRETNFFHALSNKDNIEVVNIYADEVFEENALILDFDKTNRTKKASGIIDIMGPSFAFRRGRWAFGLMSRLRGEASIPQVDGQLGYYAFHEKAFDIPFLVSPVHGVAMVWGELGLNLSRSLQEDGSLSVGATIKYLIGYEGGYASSPGPILLQREDRDNLTLFSPQIVLGGTSGILDQGAFTLNQKGKGWALDLGISKKFERTRLGLSLLDLGSVFFNNQSSVHQLMTSDSIQFFIPDYTSQNTLGGVVSQINNSVNDTTLIGDRFSIGLPRRLRLQVDYKLKEFYYLSAVLVQPFLANDKTLTHRTILGVTPRYERRWLSVHLPLVIDDFRSLRLGLGVRLGFITIGSDDLASLAGKSKLNSTSFYFAVKINPFRNTGADSFQRRSVDCPEIRAR